MPDAQLRQGDMREVLPSLEAESFDACATDPPYHLTSIVKRFGKAGAAPAKSKGATGVYGRASAGFMGQVWDGGDIAFQAETWVEVLRVLKPGAHLVAFGGTRTFHRLAIAIEDAGFEVRDRLRFDCAAETKYGAFFDSLSEEQLGVLAELLHEAEGGSELAWCFGSGFPKSHDVSKAIDKMRREDVEPVRAICRFVRAAMDANGLKSRDLVHHFDGCHPRLIDHWAARDTDSQPALPTWEQWRTLRRVLGLSDQMDAEVRRLNGRKGQDGDAWANAEVVGEHLGAPGGFGDHRFRVRDNSIRALSDAARAWRGWGTALKPAYEPILLARKPLAKSSVAANVLAHGTGALNIDGCRIEAAGGAECGRWPANLLHDASEAVVSAFPQSGGQAAAVTGQEPSAAFGGDVYGEMTGRRPAAAPRGDGGSAARFFYSAKAAKAERLGSKHPTVKPMDLMAWLVRLITPPCGRVLDPFAGSGTTGMACLREGFDALLIEREAAYLADIRRRLAHPAGGGTALFGEG